LFLPAGLSQFAKGPFGTACLQILQILGGLLWDVFLTLWTLLGKLIELSEKRTLEPVGIV